MRRRPIDENTIRINSRSCWGVLIAAVPLVGVQSGRETITTEHSVRHRAVPGGAQNCNSICTQPHPTLLTIVLVAHCLRSFSRFFSLPSLGYSSLEVTPVREVKSASMCEHGAIGSRSCHHTHLNARENLLSSDQPTSRNPRLHFPTRCAGST